MNCNDAVARPPRESQRSRTARGAAPAGAAWLPPRARARAEAPSSPRTMRPRSQVRRTVRRGQIDPAGLGAPASVARGRRVAARRGPAPSLSWARRGYTGSLRQRLFTVASIGRAYCSVLAASTGRAQGLFDRSVAARRRGLGELRRRAPPPPAQNDQNSARTIIRGCDGFREALDEIPGPAETQRRALCAPAEGRAAPATGSLVHQRAQRRSACFSEF